MPKHYAAMPTKQEFQRDTSRTTFLIVQRNMVVFPAIERILTLLDEYDRVRRTPSPLQISIVYQLYLQTRWIEKTDRNPDKLHVQHKLGGTLTPKQRDAVDGLRLYCRERLKSLLGSSDALLDADLDRHFGRPVNAASAHLDAQALTAGVIHWFQTDGARQHLKLSFRGGIAGKKKVVGGVRSDDVYQYDTDGSGDAIEFGGSLFVMDRRGRIYVWGGTKHSADLKHSSFLAGDDVLAAGTMRIEKGRVVWVSARSGHYQPVVLQMVSLLERLRGYGVDLSGVTVYRENKQHTFPGSPDLNFEPCRAEELLRLRRWPTAVRSDQMFVP